MKLRQSTVALIASMAMIISLALLRILYSTTHTPFPVEFQDAQASLTALFVGICAWKFKTYENGSPPGKDNTP